VRASPSRLCGDDAAAVVRLLKRLLKVLGRQFGVRVKGIRPDG
jgi:hypothetical protein